MLFFYIRHGDPIYDPDSLTPLGLRQAEAVAKRLALYGLVAVFQLVTLPVEFDASRRAIEVLDSEAFLESKGIHLISSEYANSNVDVPALPAEAYAIIDDESVHAVIDVGGDDRGSLALGRYAPAILRQNDYEMLLVINKFRPLTPDCASTIGVMREIETAAGMKFTGIINNSNLGDETTAEDILSSVKYAEEISKEI